MIPIKRFQDLDIIQLREFLLDPKIPFIVEWSPAVRGIREIISSISEETLARIESSDVVGFVSEEQSTQLSLPDAIARVFESGGYINGWEYYAGDCDLLRHVADSLTSLIQQN